MLNFLLNLISSSLAKLSLASATTSKNATCCWGFYEPELPEEDQEEVE